jgi:hypothetical protein
MGCAPEKSEVGFVKESKILSISCHESPDGEYSIFNPGARRTNNAMPLPLYSREREPVPIVQKGSWALGPV